MRNCIIIALPYRHANSVQNLSKPAKKRMTCQSGSNVAKVKINDIGIKIYYSGPSHTAGVDKAVSGMFYQPPAKITAWSLKLILNKKR